jgi:very-short-patch-repair endonuclease
MLKTNQLMLRKFEGANIPQRTSDKFFNATEMLKYYNSLTNSNKRIPDFWENQSIKSLYNVISKKHDDIILHETKRGKYGATWMHEELFTIFINWLERIPNQNVSRDEAVFVAYIKESFKGIIQFETQKYFDGYYVDMYSDEIKLCIEFDELYHKKQRSVDEKREQEISNKFNVNFIRHNQSENYSVTINKIIKYKESYNLVQCIKNNTIPRKGFL